ncbi:hypothetical protein Pcinc_039370 [Petrolisthes cinctipes]|uniref:Uncharacterized protein n=1 Tax=Petrolisthes cinctipes TaxID=88211 RepID=A0AAE1ELZ6_PETCI|nr:hypothetical protein Pcinc_039370 [Petrolisthes cinctipes]
MWMQRGEPKTHSGFPYTKFPCPIAMKKLCKMWMQRGEPNTHSGLPTPFPCPPSCPGECLIRVNCRCEVDPECLEARRKQTLTTREKRAAPSPFLGNLPNRGLDNLVNPRTVINPPLLPCEGRCQTRDKSGRCKRVINCSDGEPREFSPFLPPHLFRNANTNNNRRLATNSSPSTTNNGRGGTINFPTT